MTSAACPNYGITLDGTRFWVIHQKQQYGPFDYQFSPDFNGIEMHYQDEKFGECCSDEELHADLSGSGLPLKVAEVATTILGTVIHSIFTARDSQFRMDEILAQLHKHQLSRYAEGLRLLS
jgi:hypothetical protein